MRPLLFLVFFLATLGINYAQQVDNKLPITVDVIDTQRLKPGNNYQRSFPISAGKASSLKIKVRNRLSIRRLAKMSLPFLATTTYGLLRQNRSGLLLEGQPARHNLAPYVLGGSLLSGASFALKPQNKKVLVGLIYRNSAGEVLRKESHWIKLSATNTIVLQNKEANSVDVSVSASLDQELRVSVWNGEQPVKLDTTINDSPITNYDDRREEFYPDYGEVWVGYYLNDLWWSSMMNFAGYASNNDPIYYSPGGDVNGTNYPSGYYVDPAFTEPGGAGYYPTNNPGPAPVSGPGLYPKSRQAEVYQYMWNTQAGNNKEQCAFLTDKGIFLLPDNLNDAMHGILYGHPGINIQQGYNGQKSFIYKNVEYRIEGIVHTHTAQSADGLSDDDLGVANSFKAPIFGITDEGVWRLRPGDRRPGAMLDANYQHAFDKDYTISNMYGYF